MSLAVMAWAWQEPVMPPSRKFVLMAIADQARDCGHAWPTVAVIAERVGLSTRQVFTHIAALADENLLIVEPQVRADQGQVASTYIVNWDSRPPCSEPHRSREAGYIPPEQSASHSINGKNRNGNHQQNRNGAREHGGTLPLMPETVPEWYEILASITVRPQRREKAVTATDLPEMIDWQKGKGLSDDQLTITARELAGKWPGKNINVRRTFEVWALRASKSRRGTEGTRALGVAPPGIGRVFTSPTAHPPEQAGNE